MSKLISPWSNDSFQLSSPDGKFAAVFENWGEIHMGAPTVGRLRIEPWKSTVIWDSCNPSMVWSDDSQVLAIPQWTKERRQRLLLISIEYQRSMLFDRDFSVLELHSFNGLIIRGIDSPSWQPNEIEVEVTDLRWQDDQ
jgi:hypothetical protein